MASGNYLVDFDSTGFASLGSYTFPTTQSQIRDNFSDMVPRTVRIPGADGGFDQFGENKAQSEIGVVSVTFEQYADSRDSLPAEVAELSQAIDRYKLMHRRRFITVQELYQVVAGLGYHK